VLGLGRVLDRHLAALRTLEVVTESQLDVLGSSTKQPRQDANAIDKQGRVRRLVDRGFDDRRVAAQAPAIFDVFRLRVVNERAIDALEGLRAHALEIALERRPAGRLVGESDQAECAIALRIDEVKREPVVAEPIRLLDHERPQGLLAAHAGATAICGDSAREQVSLHPPRELRMGVQDRADSLELANVLVAEWSWNQR
jgi:hypothetical protein